MPLVLDISPRLTSLAGVTIRNDGSAIVLVACDRIINGRFDVVERVL